MERLLSADGSTVAIGAIGNDGNGSDSGHVRIYELAPTPTPQQGDILAPISLMSWMPMAPFNPPLTSGNPAITVFPGLI